MLDFRVISFETTDKESCGSFFIPFSPNRLVPLLKALYINLNLIGNGICLKFFKYINM